MALVFFKAQRLKSCPLVCGKMHTGVCTKTHTASKDCVFFATGAFTPLTPPQSPCLRGEVLLNVEKSKCYRVIKLRSYIVKGFNKGGYVAFQGFE
jgi:hypothetical protein